MGTRVRFAPSPSGYLHIGGARTALFSWLWAKKQGGQFILRIEDTDQERSSLESVRAILDAMRWLGLDWDEGPEVGGDYGPYFQSERKALYREAAEKLITSGKAYRCYCTKEELDARRERLKAENPKAQFVYPGTCRDRTDAPDLPHVVRFKSPKDGYTAFSDLVFSDISTPNTQLQDFVILRQNDLPLYNLACVVDDHAMKIDLVARASDHLGNTAPQILLYDALGFERPKFAHLPLMRSAKGEKLSKRHAAVSVDEYRRMGYTPMGVLNYLVRFGWSYGDQEIFTRQQLIELFDWSRVNKSDGKFDEKKFAEIAFQQLRQPELTDAATYLDELVPFLEARNLPTSERATVQQALPFVRERARTLEDAAFQLDFYLREPPEFDPKAKQKFLTADSAEVLRGFSSWLSGQPDWEPEVLEAAFKAWVEEHGYTMKQVAQPARVALTGRSASPGLFDVTKILGRERTLARLERGAEFARSN